MSLRRRLTASAVALTALAFTAGLSSGAARATSPAPHVSVISDSILTAVVWNTGPAQGILTDGTDMQIDAGVCRRLNGESCVFNGSRVPTTLSVINGWITQLGSIVVIVDGYNDLPDHFAEDAEIVLNTLRDHGVQHVLWTNLHAVSPEFTAKNAVLRAAAQHHPELRVLDWNTFSAGHADWYQTDAIHLTPAGGVGIAGFIHQAIVDTLTPPAAAPPTALSVPTHQRMRARVGVQLDGRLRDGAGATSLRWQTTSRTLRRVKLHLSAQGELTGTPSRAGRFVVPLLVSDGSGRKVRVTMSLAIRSAARHAKRA